MAKRCTVCQKSYASQANFCAVCGRPLVTQGLSSSSRNVRLFLTVVISALVTYAVFAAARTPLVVESRFFDLPSAKASAVYNLLKPRDVKVVVQKDGDRVRITGTRRECDAIADFVNLIARFRGQSPCSIEQNMARARKTWSARQTYRMPGPKSKALFDALAPDDVPVLVSWKGKRLRIDANPSDQATLEHFVQILRGRRL